MNEHIPFVYGKTVSLKAFTNREEERQKIKSNLLSGINTMLISPRRWGKSSLVEKVISEIKHDNKHVKTIMIDLFTTSTEEEFLQLFAKEIIKNSTSKWEDWISTAKEMFKTISPVISVGIDPIHDFSISFDWETIQKQVDEILDLPQKIATAKNIKFIICLDEFQNLSQFKSYPSLEKKMRAVWQKQKDVTYCIYGSKRHMMSEIFNKSSKPFYRFGDIMLLQKIKTKDWLSFIIQNFKKTGKEISETDALFIIEKMNRHSWYIQQFASYVWSKTTKKVSKIELNAALEELVGANSPLFQREIEILSVTQLNFLKAVAHNEKKLTSNAIMQKYSLGTPRNVQKNRETLSNNDIILFEKGNYEFLDPVFELWFKKQFCNKDYLTT